MKVTAVVVTYNRKDLLQECLQALFAAENLTSILVVNNGSTDGTEEMLQPWIAQNRISYLNTHENLGGAGGFYTAIKEAMKDNPDYVWLMDDDTIVKRDSLNKLLEQARAIPEAGFFSSRAMWIDGNENAMNDHYIREKNRGQSALRCQEATFVSLLVPGWVIEEVGLPIKEFFIWADDIEYTRRIYAKHPGYYVPASEVIHKTATNVGSNIALDTKDRLARYRYAYRNEVFIAKEEGLYKKAKQCAKVLYHSARVLATAKEARLEKLKVIWSASLEGLSFNPEIEFIDPDCKK